MSKKLLLFILIFLGEVLVFGDYYEKDGLLYDKKSNKPYSGPYEKYHKGKLLLKRNYKDGKLDGKQIQLYGNGQVFIEEIYEDGERDGKLTSYNLNGKKEYEEFYDDGELKNLITYTGKLKGISTFRNGKQNSPTIYYEINSSEPFTGDETVLTNGGKNKTKLSFDKGIKDKETIYVGRLRGELNYKNGKAKPPIVYYRKNKETPFTGEEKLYFNNGKVKTQMRFENGLKNGEEIIYYENGNVRFRTNYRKGLKNGRYSTYYPNGKINLERVFRSGMIHGKSTNYYKDGRKHIEGNYKFGQRDGKYKSYDYKRKKIKVSNYKKDRLVEEKLFDFEIIKDLEARNRIIYKKGDKLPYNGIGIDSNGREFRFVNGKAKFFGFEDKKEKIKEEKTEK